MRNPTSPSVNCRSVNGWLSIAAIILAGSIALPASAEDVYRWVDDNGVTHFTAHPPKDRQSDQLRTQTGHSEPVDYSTQFPSVNNTQGSNQAATQRSGETPTRAQLDDACRRAQQNLKTLEQGGRIAEEADDGSARYLSEQEKAARAERARQIVQEAC